MPFEPVFWHWWALGTILMIVELLVPGTFFLWMAESCYVVGGLLWLMPGLSVEAQAILFSILSLTSILLYRRFFLQKPIASGRPLLNRRAAQYVGRIFTLDEPIVDGRGRIRVDDTLWRVEGRDAPAGGKVRVVAAEGVVLRVEPAGRMDRSASP
jgi:membrane protein implicated in regulation of membrane protease activity